jgi:hypothetical protein
VLDAATAKLVATAPSDPAYAQLLAAQAAAQQVVSLAKLGLMANATSHNVALITSIASVPDLKLTKIGLRNTVLRIGADCYAQFIRRLVREIQPTAAVETKHEPHMSGMLAKAGGVLFDVGRSVKTLTRRVGELN